MEQKLTEEVATRAPRRIRGDGLDLAVYERGDRRAPTIVLVHGYPDNHAVWDRVAAALADRFHVVAYDVRGAGDSEAPATRDGYRLEHLIADLAAVIEATAAGPAHLVGHDWGAIQSWEAVTDARVAQWITSYTSISGPCLDHVAFWLRDSLSFSGAGRLLRQAARSWYVGFFQIPRVPEALWSAGLSRAVPRMQERTEGVTDPSPVYTSDAIHGLSLYRQNIPERLSQPQARSTNVPVQVIIPRADRFVTPALARSAIPFTPRLTVREVEGGHWILRTAPDEVARLVAEHIDRR